MQINEHSFPLIPVAFQVTEDIVIERVKNRDGRFRWAVRRNGECLSRKLVWDYEPFPSGRTEEWLRANRFDSVEVAHAVALKFMVMESHSPQKSMTNCP